MKVLPDKLVRYSSKEVEKWRYSAAVRKSKKEFRKLNPRCAWTGSTKRLNVHHKISMSIAPQLGMLHSNMVVLSRGAHLYFAHMGNFKETFLENIDEVIAIARVQHTIDSDRKR